MKRTRFQLRSSVSTKTTFGRVLAGAAGAEPVCPTTTPTRAKIAATAAHRRILPPRHGKAGRVALALKNLSVLDSRRSVDRHRAAHDDAGPEGHVTLDHQPLAVDQRRRT